jgi:uncharacterized protein (UPF0147 family)
MSQEQLNEVIQCLQEVEHDNTVPKNIKLKVSNTIKVLSEQDEMGMKINRALNELDELTDDNNIQPFTRTQIYHIVSLLEKF